MADLISEIAAMGIHRFCDEIKTADGFTYTVPPEYITSCDYSWIKKNGSVLFHPHAEEWNAVVFAEKPGSLTLSECLDEVQYVPLSEEPCGPTEVVKFIVSNRTTPIPGTGTGLFNRATPSPEVFRYTSASNNYTTLSRETDPSGYLWFLLLLVPILVFCWCKWRTQILSHFRRLKRFCCGGTGQDNSPNHVAVYDRNADKIQLDRNIQLDSNGETQPLNSNHGPVLNHAGMRADHTNITVLPNGMEINGGPNPRNNHHPKLNHADMSADLTNSPMQLSGTQSNGGPNPRNNNHPGEE